MRRKKKERKKEKRKKKNLDKNNPRTPPNFSTPQYSAITTGVKETNPPPKKPKNIQNVANVGKDVQKGHK